MESFFERNFNPAEVNRFVYDEIDAVEFYTQKLKTTYRILLGLTIFTVLLCVVMLLVALIARLPGIIVIGGFIALVITAVFYHQLRAYYWNNFSLRTVYRYQNTAYTSHPSSKYLQQLTIVQGISLASLLASLSISVLVPPPPPPPLPPTMTPTPTLTYTPSLTFTPSITPTASNTPLPSATPTQFVLVDSPRQVAVYVCPEVRCEILAILEPEDSIAVVNRDAWVEVKLEDGRRGFIPSFLVTD